MIGAGLLFTALASATAAQPVPALRFEQNLGQTDPAVRFLARARDAIVYLTPEELVFVRDQSVVRMRVPGLSPATPVTGEGAPIGWSRYHIGADPACWPPASPAFASVRYGSVKPGVDLVLHSGDDGLIEYDFELAPGADPMDVAIDFRVSGAIALDPDGSLVVRTAAGELRHRTPVVYQEDHVMGCRESVPAAFRLNPDGTVGFAIGGYDRDRPLVIDPVLLNSTYWGGSAEDRYADIEAYLGYAMVVGSTRSLDFPSQAPTQPALAGGSDAFLMTLDQSGTIVGISTYFGGSADDEAMDLALRENGFSMSYLVTGSTRSSDFPLLAPWQSSYGGGASDAFVFSINGNSRAVEYSSFLGGSGEDVGTAIHAGVSSGWVVAGYTDSADFPVANAVQPALAGGRDAFLTQSDVSPAFAASTYLGGTGDDRAVAILRNLWNPTLHVLGVTESIDFPTTPGAFQTAPAGGQDAFLTRYTPNLLSLLSSTLYGGTGNDQPSDLTINYVSGDAWLVGTTDSADLPMVNAVQPLLAGATDAFVAEISADGAQLLAATYLGGVDEDTGGGIDLDSDAGRLLLYLSGTTRSGDFPTRFSLQTGCASCPVARDAFWAVMSADTTELRCSTFFGGTGDESDVLSIKSDGLGSSHYAWFGGSTGSLDLPMVAPVQASHGGGTSDVFLARLGCEAAPVDLGNVLFATRDPLLGEVVFVWTAAPGSDEFRLYSSTDKAVPPATLVGTSAVASLRLPLPPEPRLYYKLRAANCCGEGP